MHHVFEYGLQLLEENLEYPAQIDKKETDLPPNIYTMWEKGEHWDQLILKARMFYIKRNILDKR